MRASKRAYIGQCAGPHGFFIHRLPSVDGANPLWAEHRWRRGVSLWQVGDLYERLTCPCFYLFTLPNDQLAALKCRGSSVAQSGRFHA